MTSAAMAHTTKKRSRKAATVWTLIFTYGQIGYAIVSGIFLVPLYLRYIPVELYGAWLATGNVLAWLTIVDPGVSTVVMQRVGKAYGAGDMESLNGFGWAGILITGVLAFLIWLAGYAAAPMIASLVSLESIAYQSELRQAFHVAVIASAITVLSFAIGAINRGILGSIGPGVVTLAGNILTIIATLILLFKGFGIHAIAWGLMVRAMTLLVGNVVYLAWRMVAENIPFSLKFNKIPEVLKLLSFMSFGRIGHSLARYTDAILLARFLGPETVPVLVLTRRSFNVAETFLIRPGNAMSSSLSHLSGEHNSERLREIVIRLLKINFWLMAMAVGGFFAFNESFVILWVGHDLFAGFVISTILCVLLLGRIMFSLMNIVCVALGDIEKTSLITLAHAIIVFASLCVGVYFYGMLGAVVAPLIGYFTIYLWYYPMSLSKNAYLTRDDWCYLCKQLFIPLFIALLLGMGFVNITIDSWITFITCALAYCAIFSLLLFLFLKSVRQEVATVWHFVGTKLRRA